MPLFRGQVKHIRGLTDYKDSVLVASSTNVSIDSTVSSIDGVSLSTDDRVLLTGQTNATQNGIYVKLADGTLARSFDADSSAEVTSGLSVYVEEGTSFSKSNWLLTTTGTIVPDETSLSFTKQTQIVTGLEDSYGDGSTLIGLSVQSNGIISAVTEHALDTDNITEGSTNKFYSDTLARQAISKDSYPSNVTYDNTTGEWAFAWGWLNAGTGLSGSAYNTIGHKTFSIDETYVPTLSSGVSVFTNDAGYLTASSTDTLTNKTIGASTISGNLIPDTTETYDLGSATYRFNDLYLAGVVNATTLQIAGTDITASATELNILDGVTATAAELNYVDGVTSAIQTQLDAKAPTAGPTFTGTLLVPNLVVTTPTVYAVLALEPKLVFDFTGNVFKTGGASSNFGASITHSRASSATMINASGTLVTVGNNVPRTGHHIYNGSAWVNEGILHESEARTNVCTYSNEFVNQAFLKWLPANITVTANSEVSPDGTTNATKFDMASNGYTRKTTGHVPSVGETYTFSVWIKAGTASEVKTSLLFSGGGLGYTSVTHTLTNEWQRFTVTSTLTSGTPDQVRARFVATQAGTIFVYGAQIEEGAFPSSYIPTTTSTVTRVAETLTVSAANLPYPTPVEVTGTELVTNGDFSDGLTGWTQNANATGTSNVIGGQLVQTAPHGDYSETKQLNASTVGKTYLCSFKVTAKVDSSTSVFINFGRTPVYNGSIANIPIGVFSGVVTSVHSDGFSISTRTDGQITIDNVSVKEVSHKLSIQIDGKMTGDTLTPVRWLLDANNSILLETGTNNFSFTQEAVGTVDTVTGGSFTGGTNVTFNLATRNGSTFINGAISGTSLTADTTPTALPNLSATDLILGYDFMGTIGQFRMWDEDLGDAGITVASSAIDGDDSLIRMAVNNASASNYIQFGDTSDADVGYIRYAHSNDSLYFATNAAVRMTINSSGLVGIGTITPAYTLDVNGSVDLDSLYIGGTQVTATAAELNILDGVTATAAELNYVDGVTSNVQTQLDTKASLTGTETLDNKSIDGGSF